ncbi:MAG: secretin N-terminal domain-containing protein [Opitutaceae bacterium]
MSYHPFPHVSIACLGALLLMAEPLAGQTFDPAATNPPTIQPPAATTPPAASPLAARLPAIIPATDETIGPVQMRGETLEAVLFQLARLTDRSIIRPQALPATEGYTISLPPMPKSEVILALETMLDLSGIAISPLGDRFLKVVPLGQVRTEAPEMIEGSTLGLPPSGRVASKLFRLEFLRVSELKDQVTPLLNPNLGGPVMFEKTNAALVTDSISTLQRIEQLIHQLDKPATSGLQPKFYSLHFAKASDLVNKISAILKPPLSNQVSAATSISADDRTNQIVLISDPRQYPFFDELVAKLDVKADPNTRNEVIYLKHATAKDVATLLTNVVSGRNQAADRAGQAATRAGPGVTPAPGAPPGAPTPAQPLAPNLLAEAGASSEFSSLITVLPDERSNSIVVSGTVDDIRLIREIVDKVDVLLAQVSIQVVIAEVTLTDSDKSGITALNLTVGQNLKGATGITKFDTGTGSSAGEIAGWAVTSGVVNPLSFQAAMSNVGAKSNVKVLSANTIVTTHNKQAEFVVSQQQPIITGTTSTPSATTTNTGLTTSSSVQYKDIGIKVKVTPLIGDDGSVQLEIDQTVDDIVGNVKVDANDQPIIGHREATSFVNVADGQMIVLGGLQQSKHSTSRNKLGLLYEIPILSQLLGGRNHEEDRTELLLFVRPHIIPPGEATKSTATSIDALSNKDQVNQFLKDPSKEKKESLLKQLTQ